MISPKPKKIKNLILYVIGIAGIAIMIGTLTFDSCGVNHIEILRDIENFEKTLDPEFCESVLDKIYEFNEQCRPEIEILDCG